MSMIPIPLGRCCVLSLEPLSKEDWACFVSLCESVAAEVGTEAKDDFDDSDHDNDTLAGVPKSQSTRGPDSRSREASHANMTFTPIDPAAAVLRSNDRLSGMFASLRSSLNALKLEVHVFRFFALTSTSCFLCLFTAQGL